MISPAFRGTASPRGVLVRTCGTPVDHRMRLVPRGEGMGWGSSTVTTQPWAHSQLHGFKAIEHIHGLVSLLVAKDEEVPLIQRRVVVAPQGEHAEEDQNATNEDRKTP